MASTSGSEPGPRIPGIAAYLPPAWVAIIMLLDLKGVASSYPVLSEHDLPDSVLTLIYASLAAAAVTVLWGLFLLTLAFGRSQRFPRHFVAWQVAVIVFLLAREAYVLATPEFVLSPASLAWTAGEIVVGLTMIYLATRSREAAALYASRAAARPPVLVSVLVGLLGAILGGAAGAGGGFLAGVLIADATEMSCFEGACGFFAFFIGVAGLFVGAIVGCGLAVWLVNRRPKPAA